MIIKHFCLFLKFYVSLFLNYCYISIQERNNILNYLFYTKEKKNISTLYFRKEKYQLLKYQGFIYFNENR